MHGPILETPFSTAAAHDDLVAKLVAPSPCGGARRKPNHPGAANAQEMSERERERTLSTDKANDRGQCGVATGEVEACGQAKLGSG